MVLLCCGMGDWAFFALPDGRINFNTKRIPGVVDYEKTNPAILTRKHVKGPVVYTVSPPVGGDHNAHWQECDGNVYTAQIPNERAVHSLEDGAVWITYRPGLPESEIQILAADLKHYVSMMSPYPGLDRPISVQVWGYQLKLDSASDSRIIDFMEKYTLWEMPDDGESCTTGVTATGTTVTD